MGSKIRNSYRGFVDSPHKIYAGNLGWGLTSQGLREAFAEQPLEEKEHVISSITENVSQFIRLVVKECINRIPVRV